MRCALNGWLLDSQALVILKDDFGFLFLLYNSIISCLCRSCALVFEVRLVVRFGFALCFGLLLILGKLCSLLL
jgi:hypothetical protein